MLKTRILSAFIGAPLILLVLYVRGLYLYMFVAAVSLAGLYEYYRAIASKGISINKGIGYISSVLYFIMFLLPITFDRSGFFIVLSIILLLTYEMLSQKYSFNEVCVNLFGIAYIPFLFSHLLLIERLNYGKIILFLPFLTAWFTDTLAYFVGVSMGKTKLCPKISPKKTVEGAVGGIVGSIVLNLIFGVVLNNYGIDMKIIHFAATGFLCGIASEAGDLAASYIKRYTGIKDFGSLIPGHGGVLDRFDSILFTAPLIYYYFIFIEELI